MAICGQELGVKNLFDHVRSSLLVRQRRKKRRTNTLVGLELAKNFYDRDGLYGEG